MSDRLAPLRLPEGIRSRFIDNRHGLRMHVLEAGFEGDDRHALLLLHGSPGLACSAPSRPDVLRTVALMSAPSAGLPALAAASRWQA